MFSTVRPVSDRFPYVGGIERVERKVSLATLEMIAEGLEVEPSELLK